MQLLLQRLLFNLKIAADALVMNKVRTFLTALGIIFGVASVIAMQAIGGGARQEILDQIKLVGANNIIIQQKEKTKEEKSAEENTGKDKKEPASLGLSLYDAEAIQKLIPHVERISPEIVHNVFAIYKSNGGQVRLIGVMPSYFEMLNFSLDEGKMFTEANLRESAPVCIIGSEVKRKFFGQGNAIGKNIKCGTLWLKVVGVLQSRGITQAAKQNLNLRDNNFEIYAPVQTVLLRFKNRGHITKSTFSQNQNNNDDDEATQIQKEPPVYNQVDKLIVQINDTRYLQASAEIMQRTLKRRHNNADDFEITIPELLLKQQQRTKDIFNIVLGIIAGISLLVGGIGIMNIMLVSVMERLKEIGLRMALGATKRDVVFQFMSEAILISLSGGIAGIILGVVLAKLISQFTDILTIISLPSVLVAFLVSASVGLIFGIFPARKAALQDPITSLRHE